MSDAINVEVFSCAGGMAEGFRRAGIRFDLVVDKDPNAIASYERNLGHRPVQMDAHDFLRLVRLGFRPRVDLFVADPPCTPWSTEGKRLGLDDERDCLVVTVELVRLLRPRCYLIGNVPGLETTPNIAVVQETIGSLAREGYCSADFARLDAAAYGVPQHRVRPFWFGHLTGPCLRWPEPTHVAASPTLAIPGTELAPFVTCRDALAHLPADEIGRPVRLRRRGGKRDGTKPRGSAIDEPAHVVTTRDQSGDGAIIYVPTHHSHADRPARTLTRSQGGADVVVEERDNHPPSTLDAPARCVKTNGGRSSRGGSTLLLSEKHPPSLSGEPSKTIAAGQPGNGAQVLELEPDLNRVPTDPDAPVRSMTSQARAQAWVQWPWRRPSTTATQRAGISKPGHHDPKESGAQFGPGAVVLSEKAAAILQGFPDGWVFVGKTKAARWAQIGQAMPPALAEAVARSILERDEVDSPDV